MKCKHSTLVVGHLSHLFLQFSSKGKSNTTGSVPVPLVMRLLTSLIYFKGAFATSIISECISFLESLLSPFSTSMKIATKRLMPCAKHED